VKCVEIWRNTGGEGGSASREVITGCLVEPSLASAPAGTRFQFERLGYFCADPDSSPARPVFNRTVPLRDSWGKIEKAHGQTGG